ncbi:SAVED domain-containing protein [Deinococcus wulumuqiensis]|uniref:SAVED domain-containing protein n=1 Tax=Deinococcus wulumuqiensis TaxID=980427 RepID=A0A345ILN8_9DEIO|nr:SAVED domain-containing protein [Deinococcus wulumuqiensis]AXH00611.1 SAVED domain-containing protein [Deinococcus wulumuqiensis]
MSDPEQASPAATVQQTKAKYTKLPRPPIPEQTKRELWARAAGRCQFRGCNKLLYRDEVAKEAHNGATIAHIVAYSPDGPRGDTTRSEKLEKDISNLMLTCKTHGDHIDTLELVERYPEALLLEFKRDHEERVRNATAAVDSDKTTILIVQGAVSGKRVEVEPEQARKAIKPRWPANDGETLIDLNDLAIGEGRAAYWEVATEKIKAEAKQLLRRPAGQQPPQHLSIFALAPIPLLVLLGAEVNRVDVDLFQKHRGKSADTWCWDEGEPDADDDLKVFVPAELPGEIEDAAIIVSMTSIVDRKAVASAIGHPHHAFEIKARKPGPTFLKYRSQLTSFSNELYTILTTIRDDFRRVKRLHLILACPAPIAVEVGRSLIEKADPEAHVYEYLSPSYRRVLTINPKEGN